jgi:hypothetical protein
MGIMDFRALCTSYGAQMILSVSYNIPVIQLYFLHRKKINIAPGKVLDDIWLTSIAQGESFLGS